MRALRRLSSNFSGIGSLKRIRPKVRLTSLTAAESRIRIKVLPLQADNEEKPKRRLKTKVSSYCCRYSPTPNRQRRMILWNIPYFAHHSPSSGRIESDRAGKPPLYFAKKNH